jgi:hypothetical protein
VRTGTGRQIAKHRCTEGGGNRAGTGRTSRIVAPARSDREGGEPLRRDRSLRGEGGGQVAVTEISMRFQ